MSGSEFRVPISMITDLGHVFQHKHALISEIARLLPDAINVDAISNVLLRRHNEVFSKKVCTGDIDLERIHPVLTDFNIGIRKLDNKLDAIANIIKSDDDYTEKLHDIKMLLI